MRQAAVCRPMGDEGRKKKMKEGENDSPLAAEHPK
jgi:hypothetical protein